MAAILLCINLNAKALNEAKRRKCDRVIFIREAAGLPAVDGILRINANDYERESYHHTFSENKRKLESFRVADPVFFQCGSLDLLEAINKDYFWMTRYEGMLLYAAEKIREKGDAVHFYSPGWNEIKNGLKVLRLFFLYLKGVLAPISKAPPEDDRLKGKKFGFYVENRFQREYYSGLVRELGEENCIFLSNHSDKSDFSSGSYRIVPQRLPMGTLTNGLKRFGADTMLRLWSIRQHLLNAMQSNLSNFNSDIKVFFLVAQENTGFGNMTSAMGKKHGKLIVNSHNGIKSADAYNRDNHFDVWLCWDEKMKEMLQKECLIDGRQLVVAGHLMEDRALNHVQKGSFSEFYDSRENKKIISLFSINDHPKSKWNLIHSMVRLVIERSDLKLIIRLHPSEDPEEWNALIASADRNKVHIVRPKVTDNKDQLYDQLLISDAAIVFGSTVAVECRWFGVPCITFEERERSILYGVDNENILHVSSLDRLNGVLNGLLEKGRRIVSPSRETTAGRIKKIVEERIEVMPGS